MLVRTALTGWLLLAVLMAAATGDPLQEVADLSAQREFKEALARLDALEKDDQTDPEVFKVLALERALVLVEASRNSRDAAKILGDRSLAEEACRKFLKQHDKHPRTAECRQLLGTALAESARHHTQRGQQATVEKRKAASFAVARQLYVESGEVFQRIVDDTKAELLAMRMPIPPDQKELLKTRNERRTRLLQANLLVAAMLEESADAQPTEKDRQEVLHKAIDAYKSIHERYRTRLAGMYAYFYGARCHQKAGQYREALAVLTELMALPESPAVFRNLKRRAVALQVESYLEIGRPRRAITAGEAAIADYEKELDVNERAALQLIIARAELEGVEKLPADSAEHRLAAEKAVALLLEATKGSQATRNAARKLLATRVQVEDPKSFDEAIGIGIGSLNELKTVVAALAVLETKIAAEREEAIRDRLKQERDATRQSVEKLRASTARYFELALKQADNQTPIAGVNRAHYVLAYLAYREKDYAQAASHAGPLANDHPNDSSAPAAAKIHLACLIQNYHGGDAAERKQMLPDVVRFAEYALKTWSDQPVAVDAARTLVPLMVAHGDQDAAESYRKRLKQLLERQNP